MVAIKSYRLRRISICLVLRERRVSVEYVVPDRLKSHGIRSAKIESDAWYV